MILESEIPQKNFFFKGMCTSPFPGPILTNNLSMKLRKESALSIFLGLPDYHRVQSLELSITGNVVKGEN